MREFRSPYLGKLGYSSRPEEQRYPFLFVIIIIIIRYIYHALIHSLSAHMIHYDILYTCRA